MRWQEIRAHRLAHTIMRMQARELAAQRHRDWLYLYDPLAATCLGNLIYQTMTKSARKSESKHGLPPAPKDG